MPARDGGRNEDLRRSEVRGRGQRVMRLLVLASAALVALETASYLGLWVRDRALPSPSGWREERRRVAEEAAVGPFPDPLGVRERKALHPYLGFTNARRFQWRGRFPVDQFGFAQVDRPPAPKGAYVVGVFGGSVAQMLALFEFSELERRLESLPAVAGRSVRVVDLAMTGFKEPQQLMSLVWTQSTGVRIDAAVLLDGFNDGVFPEVHNRPEGVSAYYPRGWRSLSDGAIDPGRLLAGGELMLIERRRERWSRLSSTPPFAWSAACELVWSWWDRERARSAAVLRRQLEERNERGRATHLGPADPERPHERRKAVAAYWGRCAVLMRQICDERGIAFAHFLQPNQYVPGSKPMSATERRIAVRPDGPYALPVATAYPELQRVGRELRAAGEPFVDLTDLFARIEEPVYSDDCCHLNDRGNRLLAVAVAEGLALEIARAEARRLLR